MSATRLTLEVPAWPSARSKRCSTLSRRRSAPNRRPPVSRYRCHRRQCPDCGAITLAPLPDEHAHQFGPQLTALVAYLTVVCRMPRLVVQRFLEGALQIPISLGSTQNAWEETSAAVASP